MNKIRLGIIGTGGISNSHVKAYKQMDDVEIVAGADIIPGKAREALDRWELPDAKAFENTQEMLDTMELDAVSVCTYNTAHAECAIQAMRAGKHVICEKPLTGYFGKKGEEIKVLKTEGLTTLADYFVICTATSTTQIKAMSDACEEAMEKNGEQVHHIEGHRGGTWLLMDFSAVVVHIFMDEARKFYDLERLWGDAEEIPLEKPQAAQ